MFGSLAMANAGVNTMVPAGIRVPSEILTSLRARRWNVAVFSYLVSWSVESDKGIYSLVTCPLNLSDSFMKLSNFFNFPILSTVHWPLASAKVSSISFFRIVWNSGHVARLKMMFVIKWLVLPTLTDAIASCIMACKCASLLSGSGMRSRTHWMQSFGFL